VGVKNDLELIVREKPMHLPGIRISSSNMWPVNIFTELSRLTITQMKAEHGGAAVTL
jgi:hypothetical protein